MWRFCKRFVDEGRMPNLERMIKRGSVVEMLSTFPPLTGTAWTTIASGAWPSTTGVEGHWIHFEGEPFEQIHRSYNSQMVKTERIWQTAERAGKTPMLLKFPVTWPPTVTNGYQFSGCGGYADQDCAFQIAHVRCYTTDPTVTDVRGWYVTPVNRVELRQAQKWDSRNIDTSDAYETCIIVEPDRGGEPKRYHGLIAKTNGEWRLWLSPTRNVDKALCVLARGEWSDWLEDEFVVEGRKTRGYFKAKLLEIQPHHDKIKLYFSTIHEVEGNSFPESLSQTIYDRVGPLWEEVHVHDLVAGWIDDETWIEICEQHTDSMVSAAKYMMRNLPWDLFWTQWHPIDYTLHQFYPGIDPQFPGHDPQKSEYYWNIIGRVHSQADRLIGAILEEVDSDTLICVAGDHGHTLWHTTLSLNNLLVKEGLIHVDGFEGDRALIDWSKSRAFCDCNDSVFLNVQGRDPYGCVKPGEEYEKLRQKVIALLYDLRDKDSGEPVVELAVTREAARGFGIFGGGIGDVVFSMRSGYRSIVRGRDGWERNFGISPGYSVFEPRKAFKTLTSEHGQFSPWNPDLHTVSIWQGPGIRASGHPNALGRLVDIAPTFCHVLGMPFPRDNEGSVMYSILTQSGSA